MDDMDIEGCNGMDTTKLDSGSNNNGSTMIMQPFIYKQTLYHYTIVN
jgi:hypothetical protein